MNNHINTFQKNIIYLGGFLIGETVLQLLLILKSFMIIRILPTSQYAEYSLFVSITTTFFVLGSGTFAGGNLLKFISNCQNNLQKLSNLYYSVFWINKYYILFSAPLLFGFLAYSLLRLNTNPLEILLLSFLSVLFLASQMHVNIQKIFLVANKDVNVLNRHLSLAEAAKIIPILILKNVISFSSLSLCLFFSSINLILARALSKSCNLQKTFDLTEHKKVISQFKSIISPIVPGILFSTLQTQLPVFIAVTFGNVQSVAEVGALSKLALIYSFMSAFNLKILSPFVARSASKNLMSRYFSAVFLVLLLAGSILIICLSFPYLLLNLLGENYYDLDAYKWIIILGSLNYINQSLWSFNSSQHWIYNWMPLLSIPGTILIQIVFVYFNSMAEPSSIFKMMTFASIFVLFNRFLVTFVGFKRLQISAVTQ